MRVYELAKSYNLESRDVLAVAKKNKIDVKASASAALEDKDIRKLHPLLEAYKKEMASRENGERRKSSEDEALKREEALRQKAEQSQKEAEERRRQEEERARKAADDQRRASEEEARRQAAAAAEAERNKVEEKSRAVEDSRLRSLGLPVPQGRPAVGAGFGAPRPATPPTAAPTTTPAVAAAAPGRPPGSTLPTGPAPRPISPATPAPRSPSGLPPIPRATPGGGIPRPQPGQGAPITGRQTPPTPGAGTGVRPGGGTGILPPRPAQDPNAPPRPGAPRAQTPGSSLPRGPAPRPILNQPPTPGGLPRGDRPDRPRPDRELRNDRTDRGPRPDGERSFRPTGDRPDRGPRPTGPGGYNSERGPRPAGPGGDRGPRPGGFNADRGPGPRPAGPGGDRAPRPAGEMRPRTPLPPRRDEMPGRFDDIRENQPRRPRPDASSGEPGGLQIGVMRMDKPAARRPGDKDKKPAAAKGAKGKAAPRKIFELDEEIGGAAKPRAGGTGRPNRGAPLDPAVGRPRFGSRKRPGKKNRNAQGGGGSVSYNDLGQREVFITPPLTVGEFAAACGTPVTEIIKRVMMMGEVLNINAHMSEDLMELIAPELNVELTIEKVGDEFDIEDYLPETDEERLVRRAPVVTIMGHVDHGKTSLLDYIRRAKVAEGEFGGITQHIGAYHVSTSKGDIVFLDTPGHEAFTSMRARGAQITDIVILVVAANDSFKPQTIEAMNHALAAKVPIVVAVNKIDLPDADPNRVRQDALKHGLIPEELGGEYMFVDVSAKKGINIDTLLESVALQAEILDLKADPGTNAMGLVIESHIDPLRGAVATILVEQGTLRVGDDFVCGDVHGRVRAMLDDRGREVEAAGPSSPVEILGLSDSPAAGEVFLVVPDEQIARGIAEKRADRRRVKALAPVTHRHMTLETLHEHMKEGETKYLNVVLKADVQGSIEAVGQALEKLSNEQIRIRILHSAVGGVTENDVNLAAASDAIIFGFNVRPDAKTEAAAEAEGIEIKTYRIIYDLLEDVKAAMAGLLSPTKREKILGHAEVLQLFRISRIGTIAGCIVRDGEIVRSAKIRLLRQGVVIYEGNLASLKRLKDDVRKVASGLECGMNIENYNDLKEGDIIEAYEIEEVAGQLLPATGGSENL